MFFAHRLATENSARTEPARPFNYGQILRVFIMFIEIPANKKSIAKRKLIYGTGINDVDYVVRPVINGKTLMCPFYRTWHSMLMRCFDPKRQERQPTYKNCAVCDEWLIFSNFKRWMVKQNWQNKALDKDITEPGNKVYSPAKCVFVTQALNNLLTDHQSRRGKYPLGVSWDKQRRKFRAYCNVDRVNKKLGHFNTPGEAAAKYNTTKANEITRVARLQTNVHIRDGLLKHAELRERGLN